MRRWTDWASGFYYNSNGVWIGGMWFDEELQVLWYTMHAQYGGPEQPPFLGASRLNDDGTVTKYGPWMHPLGGSRYRTSSWWIYEAPPSVKSANPDAQMCLGAAVGSTAGPGNFGPGLYWYKKPSLSSSGPLKASEWGPLQGYSSLYAPQPDFFCHREADYNVVYKDASGFHPVINGVGRWLSNLDQMSGHAWITDDDKEGIITLGRMVAPNRWIWYPQYGSTRGYNPHTVDGVTYYASGFSNGNSYKVGVRWPSADRGAPFVPALLLFSSGHALEVMRGKRRPPDVQYYHRANWGELWPQMPFTPGTPAPHGLAEYPNPGSYTVIDSPQGQPCTSVYDRTTQTLLWALPRTYNPGLSRFMTIQCWQVV